MRNPEGKTHKKKRVQYATKQVIITRRLPLNHANYKVIIYQFDEHFATVKYGRDFVNKLAN